MDPYPTRHPDPLQTGGTSVKISTMLIPQFTIRWMLGLTTVCAVIFSIFALALRGSATAAAVSMAIVALVLVMFAHVLLFALVWVFSAVLPRRFTSRVETVSPFGVQEIPAAPILLDE